MNRKKRTIISLHKPFWGKEEQAVLLEAMKQSDGVGEGVYTKKLNGIVKKLTHSKYVFAVPSCTQGLELACRAMGIGAGDEVIVPGFTLSSSVNCVVLTGAHPVFADIKEDTYCIDSKSILRLITKKTKGIIVVHYAGMPCDMEEIQKIAKQHELFIIEDSAHAIGAYYKGKMLGTFGDIGVFSFHGTKNIACGEGGMVVTNNKNLADFMDVYRMNGTNRSAFLDHRISLYTWMGPGSNYLLPDILAALLLAQLSKLQWITKKRTEVAKAYSQAFSGYTHIHLPVIPEGAHPNWHIYAIRFDSPILAQKFTAYMKAHRITAIRHYVPVHSSPMGKSISGNTYTPLPVVERVAETLVRLPIYPALSDRDLSYVCRTAERFFKKYDSSH